MLESIVSFYGSLPLVVRWGIGFWFNVIIVRGIIANEIMAELEKHGVKKGHVVEDIRKAIERKLFGSPRKAAIRSHYTSGHGAPDVLACPETSCRTVFAS